MNPADKLNDERKPLLKLTKNSDGEFWLHIDNRNPNGSASKQAGINLGCFPPGRVATEALELALDAQLETATPASNFVAAWREIESILYAINVDKGFMVPGQPVDIGMQICLIHSEISEAVEAHRKDLYDDKLPNRKGLEVEFADAVIRVFNLAAHLGLDIPGALIEKTHFNSNRPFMHGGKKF